MIGFLSGRFFLLTRPHQQAESLRRSMVAEGGECVVFPSIEIRALPVSSENTPHTFSKIIFTSANAVEYSKNFLQNHSDDANILAIGRGTETALKKCGIHSAIPEKYSTEGLLTLPSLQSIRQEKIAIITGKNARPGLKEILEQRGAVVSEIICYERICPQYSEENISKIVQPHFDAIVSYSLESLKNLEVIFLNHLPWLKSQQFLVVTKEMRDYCSDQHFLKPAQLAEKVSDDAVLKVLCRLQDIA